MKIIDREISWLHFNSRLLQEAADKDVPLMERIKFLGIYSNNLDEFYRVRVASTHRLIDFNKKNYPAKVAESEKLYSEIKDYIACRQKEFNQIKDEIFKEFEKHHVYMRDEKELNEEQVIFVKNFFKEKILPGLFTVRLTRNADLSSLNDGTIYLAIVLQKPDKNKKKDYALIRIPADEFSRFIVLPKKGSYQSIIMLDDIIRFCLKDIFSVFGYARYDAYTIKITRDAEIDMYGNVSKSFIDIVAESIKKRQTGAPVRFIYDSCMPADLIDILIHCFKIKNKDHITKGARYHNSKDYMSFPNLLGEKFVYPAISPIPHRDINKDFTILSSIKKKDILLHYPYNSFNYILNMLREASVDPKVKSIKITLYRLADDSKIINALINAANNGKRVTAFLELKARFNEEHNIYWTNKLEEAGVTIIKTISGIKVHSKLILIHTKEKKENIYYSVISTGNFNERTAKVYSDISLLTANQEIGIDVGKVFYLIESAYRIINFDHLIVSPLYTRTRLMTLINNEIKNASKGRKAWIDLKLNSLTDSVFVEKLKEAAKAGVKIRISSRASCCLIGNENENITTIGIVDRFLEHARIFAFCNSNKPLYFIGSSDIMIRNLDLRIEVTTPVYDKNLQKELQYILDVQFKDNVSARDWNSEEKNNIRNMPGKKVRTQEEIYKYLKKINKKSSD
ncbi:MAG: polyphosphate kinase 1 [Bacteroidales bacterium]|jgi:polyphosphate kinase|nr:polyphosphate kinase 1 [Bacteroidales bacterium]